MLQRSTFRSIGRHTLALRPHARPTTLISSPSRQGRVISHLPQKLTGIPSRRITIKPTPAKDSSTILEKQRLNRPSSPHLSIIRPQIAWLGSVTGRITGSVVSGTLYLFFAAYASAPLFGWDLSSENVAAAVAGAPAALVIGAKGLLGFAFSYHCANGIRHLVWDFGRGIKNRAVRRSGWFVVGLSVVSALGLAAY